MNLRQAANRAGTSCLPWGPLFIQLNCKEKLNSSLQGGKLKKRRVCLSRGVSLGIDFGGGGALGKFGAAGTNRAQTGQSGMAKKLAVLPPGYRVLRTCQLSRHLSPDRWPLMGVA